MGKEVMRGIASIALLPNGSISGHFIHLPHSVCYGLHGTGCSRTVETASSELACERECSRGEDYRLIKLSIVDYIHDREQVVVVECKGHDAARFSTIDHAHGWDADVIGMVEQKHGKPDISASFVCETLKAENAAEEHIRKYMPNIAGVDAVVNIGPMSISGLKSDEEEDDNSGKRLVEFEEEDDSIVSNI